MKRILALALACTLLLAACGKKAPTPSAPAPESTAQLAELNAATGAKLAVPTCVVVEEEYFEQVEIEGCAVAQYVFLASDMPCGIRFCADKTVDISEMTNENGVPILPLLDEDVTGEYQGSLVARWLTDDGQYIVYMDTADEEFFEAFLAELKKMTA